MELSIIYEFAAPVFPISVIVINYPREELYAYKMILYLKANNSHFSS